MRKFLVPSALLLLVAALVVGAAQAGRKADPVKITIGTYVWQPTTVAAMKNIVDSWNKTHSNIQVSIVPVDVNSVHDKLLTSFVGGTSADVVHDEAADIAGFTQQGYLANLSPLISKKLKALGPPVAVEHGQLREADHGRASVAPDLQRLCQHGDPEAGGDQGPDASRIRGRGRSSGRRRRS